MNTNEIEKQNAKNLTTAETLLNKVEATDPIPYVNGAVVGRGLINMASQTIAGGCSITGKDNLTPLQRAVFVWAYLELIIGLLQFLLEEHGVAECLYLRRSEQAKMQARANGGKE